MPIKSLDDLSDQPLADRPAMTSDADEFVAAANALLDDARFSFASETIERMRDWSTSTGRVTQPMIAALENITRSVTDRPEHDRRRGGSRRYEGWGGRGR